VLALVMFAGMGAVLAAPTDEDFYAGEWVKDAAGRSYLEIRVRPDPGDMRTDPISYTHPALSPSLLGTHILDYSWGLGDLIRLVQTKAAAMP